MPSQRGRRRQSKHPDQLTFRASLPVLPSKSGCEILLTAVGRSKYRAASGRYGARAAARSLQARQALRVRDSWGDQKPTCGEKRFLSDYVAARMRRAYAEIGRA